MHVYQLTIFAFIFIFFYEYVDVEDFFILGNEHTLLPILSFISRFRKKKRKMGLMKEGNSLIMQRNYGGTKKELKITFQLF